MNEDLSLLNDIPMGFGMALAKNVNAMKYFAGLRGNDRPKLSARRMRYPQSRKCRPLWNA